MRAGLGSTFPPPLLVRGLARSVTLVGSLVNQYVEMPLSHIAQIDATFLRQVSYGALVSSELSPHAPALWCL